MRIKLFIDFDGTLFDTEAFKEKMHDIFVRAGFEKDDIKATYSAECLDYKYSPIGQMKRLEKIHPFDTTAANQRFAKLYKTCSQYLYSDSIEFLKIVNKEKYELILFTLGDVLFQKTKIDHCGIAKYFDSIYYTEIQKWEYLDNLVKQTEKFVVIDDRGDALLEIQKIFKGSLVIQIIRSVKDEDDPFIQQPSNFSGISVKNLKQARQYL